MAMRARLCVVIMAAVAVLAAGCGTRQASAVALSAAVANTAATTSRVAVSTTMSSPGMTTTITATGEFDYAHPRGVLRMGGGLAPGGVEVRYLLPRLYVKFAGTAGVPVRSSRIGCQPTVPTTRSAAHRSPSSDATQTTTPSARVAAHIGGSWSPWKSLLVTSLGIPEGRRVLRPFAWPALAGHGDVAIDPAEPPLADKVVHERIGPVPLPGEPAPQLGLRRDDGRAHGGGQQVPERDHGVLASAAAARVDLIPADQLAGMPVALAGGDLQRARHDRAAPLQRCPQRLQLLPVGAEYPCLLMRPGHIRGSGRRADPAAGPGPSSP